MNKGYTLVELLIVLSVFGILLVAGTNLFMQVMLSANRVRVENEVRQNINIVLEEMVREVRRSVCLRVEGNGTILKLYNRENCSAADIALATFSLVSDDIQKQINADPAQSMLYQRVMAGHYPSGCTGDAADLEPGLNFSLNANQRAVDIVLKLQSRTTSNRSDYCGKIELRETVSLRNY